MHGLVVLGVVHVGGLARRVSSGLHCLMSWWFERVGVSEEKDWVSCCCFEFWFLKVIIRSSYAPLIMFKI